MMKLHIRHCLVSFLLSVTFFPGPSVAAQSPEWDILSAGERVLVDRILEHWASWVPAMKADGTAPMMTFDQLYDGLGEEEIRLLKAVKSIDPGKRFGFQGEYLGTSREGVDFVRLKDQWVERDGKREEIPPQYLPREVYEAYEAMMTAMEADLGKRLLVESGYRSPAYQLYTFLYYLPGHGYSLVETGHWVAIPGYSEHGAPHQQALDFINEKGINGEENPENFEALPEYRWLNKNAASYGFLLSYPRDQTGITFEPWHWSFHPQQAQKSA